MAEWWLELRGDKFDLEELQNQFTSENLAIIEVEGKYLLKSKEFAALNTEPEVYKRGELLLERINGTMKVVMNNYHSVDIEAVIYVDDQGVSYRNIRIKAEAGAYRSKFSGHLRLIHEKEKPNENSHREVRKIDEMSWPEVAGQDHNVAKVLRLFNKELDWVNLYKILEVVQEDKAKECTLAKKGWASNKAIDLFEHTANSYRAIGDAARHAKEKHMPPPVPMPLGKARALIRSIVTNWLEEKAKYFSSIDTQK